MKPAGGLRFEHVGPEDASGPPFVVAVGAPADSTESCLLVTASFHAAIRALVLHHGVAGDADDEPAGAFAVSATGMGTRVLAPEGMGLVLDALRCMYAAEHVAPPALLGILETLNRKASGDGKAKNPRRH